MEILNIQVPPESCIGRTSACGYLTGLERRYDNSVDTLGLFYCQLLNGSKSVIAMGVTWNM